MMNEVKWINYKIEKDRKLFIDPEILSEKSPNVTEKDEFDVIKID